MSEAVGGYLQVIRVQRATMARDAADCRESDESFELPGNGMSFLDMFPGFPEESKKPPDSSYDSSEEEDDEETSCNVEENRIFWKSQDELLQATLRRTSSIELTIRRAMKNVLRELNFQSIQCACRRPVEVAGCGDCMQREICSRLRDIGYNCAICKSKWKSSPDIPSGEHTYLEVADDSNITMEGEVRVIIELNFRAEFEIARAGEEYKRLVRRLPEVFVGTPRKLRELIKILCNAAKKSMKEKKMHLGPWRKYRYMQAKWLGMGKCERTTPAPLPKVFSDQQSKAKASMLTFDLRQSLPALHRSAVEVV